MATGGFALSLLFCRWQYHMPAASKILKAMACNGRAPSSLKQQTEKCSTESSSMSSWQSEQMSVKPLLLEWPSMSWIGCGRGPWNHTPSFTTQGSKNKQWNEVNEPNLAGFVDPNFQSFSQGATTLGGNQPSRWILMGSNKIPTCSWRWIPCATTSNHAGLTGAFKEPWMMRYGWSTFRKLKPAAISYISLLLLLGSCQSLWMDSAICHHISQHSQPMDFLWGPLLLAVISWWGRTFSGSHDTVWPFDIIWCHLESVA